jgi:hypothetical protein
VTNQSCWCELGVALNKGKPNRHALRYCAQQCALARTRRPLKQHMSTSDKCRDYQLNFALTPDNIVGNSANDLS